MQRVQEVCARDVQAVPGEAVGEGVVLRKDRPPERSRVLAEVVAHRRGRALHVPLLQPLQHLDSFTIQLSRLPSAVSIYVRAGKLGKLALPATTKLDIMQNSIHVHLIEITKGIAEKL